MKTKPMNFKVSRITIARNSHEKDIVTLILADHKPLKELIKILKNPDKPFSRKKIAFETFAPAFLGHVKPEEKSLYNAMKKISSLKDDAKEGDAEHARADRMIEEIRAVEADRETWMDKTKLLAELVEHHIKEEEDIVLPAFKEKTDKSLRMKLGRIYREDKSEAEGSVDANPLKKVA